MNGLMMSGGHIKAPKRVLLDNSTGHIASGTWVLNYSRTFSGYTGFVVVSTGLDDYDDANRKYAGVFVFNDCNKKSTTITITSPAYFGHGYQVYGISS